jgi:4-aminobutyrate aminotransferase-like enzyme
MLMPHPTVLRNLVERYETLRATAERHTDGSDRTEGSDPLVRQQLQDTIYTLCVSTGTREVGAALKAARKHMEAVAEFGAAPVSDANAA